MSVVEKDDVADISYGSKGWLMDDASQKCMGCQGTFYYLSNRRHHCRLVYSFLFTVNLCDITRHWNKFRGFDHSLVLLWIINCFDSNIEYSSIRGKLLKVFGYQNYLFSEIVEVYFVLHVRNVPFFEYTKIKAVMCECAINVMSLWQKHDHINYIQ